MINIWKDRVIKNDVTILFLGQSNAGDRFNVGSLSETYSTIAKNYPNVNYISYSNNLTQYSGTKQFGGYDRSSGNAGIDLGMISLIEKKVNIIKYFYGSKGLKQQSGDTDFNPLSANELYDVGIFKGDGTGFCEQIVNEHGLKVDFVIWVQGEQDAVINSETYEADLETLTSQLRTDFNNPNLIFIYNQLHEDFYYYDSTEHAEPGKTNVRLGQSNFNDSGINKMIQIDDVSIGDIYNVHFDANACAEIGIRIGTYVNNRL